MADVIVAAPGLRPRRSSPGHDAAREAPLPDRRRGVRLLDVASGPRHRHRALLRRRGPRGLAGQDLQQDPLQHGPGPARRSTAWVVKPVEVDDVPIVNVTLWCDRPERYGDYELRRMAEEVRERAPGGSRHQPRLGGRRPAAADPRRARRRTRWPRGRPRPSRWPGPCGASNAQRPGRQLRPARTLDPRRCRRLRLRRSRACGELVVDVVDGTAGLPRRRGRRCIDGPAEADSYSWIGFGPAESGPRASARGELLPAVHIAVAKQKGTNAVRVAERGRASGWPSCEATLLPDGVHLASPATTARPPTTRSTSWSRACAVAIVIVIGLIAWCSAGARRWWWRWPCRSRFSLTLLVNYSPATRSTA